MSDHTSGPTKQRPKIEDFFKPYRQTNAIIPQKRSSPSGPDQDAATVRTCAPKTPVKTVTFKDVTPNSHRTIYFSPLSQSSLPIRSPKHNKALSPSLDRRTNQEEEDITKASPRYNSHQNVSFTFSDILERSQKIVEGGKLVAVKDSDEDTDSLESLEDIFGRREDATATSDSSPLEDNESKRLKAVNMFTSGRPVPLTSKDKLRALHAKDKATKFDLSVILDDHFGDEEAQQNISRMRAGLDVAKDFDEDDLFDQDLLASVVQTGDADQEDIDRLLNAVERTEALSSGKVFSFFGAGRDTSSKATKARAFPVHAIPDQLWTPRNTAAQNRAYLSGYMSELACSGDLADEALKWMFEQVVVEPRVDLRLAYTQCLRGASKTWTRLSITVADIQSLFHNLGTHPDCLRDASSIEPRYQPMQEHLDTDYGHLLTVLQMLQAICLDMDFSALSKLCSVVLRLLLDKLVMSDGRVCVAAERLLETLLSLPDEETQSHVYERLLSDATHHLQDPKLQARLLNHIIPTTPKAIQLRKALADLFLLGPSVISTDTKQHSATITDLSKHISTSPHFSLTRHSNSSAIDYSALTARTQILNIAVSSGNPPSSLDTESPSPPLNQTAISKPSTEEVSFNKSVDALADQLHSLLVSIKDTGASHMRRTEAKDALQALYFRLLFSVRTKPRKKKHVFDLNGEMKGGSLKGRWVSGEQWRENERAGEFMKRFLTRKEEVVG